MEKRTGKEVAAAVGLALLSAGILGCFPVMVDSSAGQAAPISAEGNRSAFRDSMRTLWANHAIWTREYIVSAIAGGPDAADLADRLLKNKDDIAAAFAAYYGDKTGAALAELLKQHILIAADLVDAAKTANDGKFGDSNRRWHENADAIAAFLNGINPLWTKTMLLAMFNDHLTLTTAEVNSRVGKKWTDDISAFDKTFAHMTTMADVLSNGVIRQFPEKFQ